MESAVVAAALLVAIVAYNVTHAATAMSMLLMGACRALAHLAPIVAIAGFDLPGYAFAPAVAAWVYTVMVSMFARHEADAAHGPMHSAAWSLPVAPLLIALSLRPTSWIAPAIAAVVMTFWLARAASFLQPPKARPVPAVLAMLAGFCLIDAWTLLLLNQPVPALAAGVFFVLTVLGHRRILGT
jgi:hypothetical protein